MNAWDELADAIREVESAAVTTRQELAMRPVFKALRQVAEKEGTRSSYRSEDYDVKEQLDRAADEVETG